MSNKSDRVKKWRKNTKARLVKAMGGKCVICGYCKCENALDFHHLNPLEKDFSFGAIRANIKNWLEIVQEIKKCVLLCANCHREIHSNMASLPENIPIFLKELEDYKTLEKLKYAEEKTKICLVCNKSFKKSTIYCSVSCSGKAKNKIDWGLYDLYELCQKQSLVSLAEELNVSGKTIKKYLIVQLKQKGLTYQEYLKIRFFPG